jgi:hypothetical protein
MGRVDSNPRHGDQKSGQTSYEKLRLTETCCISHESRLQRTADDVGDPEVYRAGAAATPIQTVVAWSVKIVG